MAFWYVRTEKVCHASQDTCVTFVSRSELKTELRRDSYIFRTVTAEFLSAFRDIEQHTVFTMKNNNNNNNKSCRVAIAIIRISVYLYPIKNTSV